MASFRRNIEYIKKHFSDYSDFIIKKIEKENITLSRHSTKYVSDICYPLSNYIDFVNGGNVSELDELYINEIIEKYKIWVIDNSKSFNTKNYVEKNEIILDYKINGIGFYWVNLNSYYSSEMVFRLNNCARVNSYQNFLELREYDVDGFNHSRVVVVINNDGFINQIRGNHNTRADIMYRNHIFDLFLNYKIISGFKFLFSKESDFTHMDLTKEQLNNLKSVRPELFKLI